MLKTCNHTLLFIFGKGLYNTVMALEAKRKLTNGTVVTHHRIVKTEVDFDAGKIIATVASYVDDDIRGLEKNSATEIEQLAELRQELDTLVAEPTEENEADRQKLSDKINELVKDGEPVPQNLNIVTTTYELKLTGKENYTRTQVYAFLKTLPEFSDAVDA